MMMPSSVKSQRVCNNVETMGGRLEPLGWRQSEKQLLMAGERGLAELLDCSSGDELSLGSGGGGGLVLERSGAFSRLLAVKSVNWARDSLQRLPIRLTLENVGLFAVVLALLMPRALTYLLLYPIFRLVFGTLYPAYASYKAVRTKNVKEYVKWMMYWIVFALFTCAETFTDVFFSFWFPFYYEIKIILVLWLLSPATKGSSILYRRFVHPALCRREAEIDDAIARATEQGYTAFLQLGSKGVNYATTMLMQTAIKNLPNVTVTGPVSTSQSDSAISSLASRRVSPSRSETDFGMMEMSSPNQGRQRRAPRRRTKSDDPNPAKAKQVVELSDNSPRDDDDDDGDEEDFMDLDYVPSAGEMTIDSVDFSEFKRPEPVRKPATPKRTAKNRRDDSVTRRKPRTRGRSARSVDSDASD